MEKGRKAFMGATNVELFSAGGKWINSMKAAMSGGQVAILSKARVDKSGIFKGCLSRVGMGIIQMGLYCIPRGVVLYLYLYLSRVGDGMRSIPRGVPTVE